MSKVEYPFFKFFKSFISFVVVCIEVLVVTPLWLVFHMTPDGKGFANNNVKVGYGILLEAALRPVLIIFGLLAAYVVMWPLLIFFHHSYSLVLGSVNTESVIDVAAAVVVQATIYLVFCLMMIIKSCDIMDVLPGTVLKWINFR